MSAPHATASFKRGQITADGGSGRFHMLGKLFQRRKFNTLKVSFNAVFALICRHNFNNLIDIGRFCKINVDLILIFAKFVQSLCLSPHQHPIVPSLNTWFAKRFMRVSASRCRVPRVD